MMLRTLLCSAVMTLGLAAPLAPGAHADEVTIEDFAIRPVMRSVELSPDGERLAYRVAQTKMGDYMIEVRDVDDLDGKPVRLGSKTMSITGFSWLSDERLLVTFRQRVRDQIKDQNEGVFESKRAIVRADGKGRWNEIYDDLSIASPLPDNPDKILVRTSKFNREDARKIQQQGRSISDIQVRDFYEMDVDSGALKLVRNANARFGGYVFDLDGNLRLANEYDAGARASIWYAKGSANDADWEEIYRTSVDDYETSFDILGFDPQDENMLFVSANRGEDNASIWLFDLNNKEFVEQIMAVEGQDLENAWYSSNPSEPNKIVGFVYYDADGRMEIVFLDGEEKALHESLQATFPGKDIYITSRSRDNSELTVYTTNWDDPGTYYLVTQEGIQLIGKTRPTLEPEELHEQTYIRYEARDGRTIPAYLTIPDGEGPFPVVVMPHGGPWVSYRPQPFDEWSQMLANEGYLVIDPLFRGTTGLGADHWLSSFGEWGKAMSDDMDDGVAYLVEQGLADPDRAAMFGWSFGGYSAFAASVRQPQIYQCVIAGAGVSDPIEFRAAFTGNRALRPQLEKGYAGLVAANSTADVSVPILIIHGELDQRVRIIHSEQFVSGLKSNDKPHEFLVLEGADHFDDTLEYDHRVEMYDAMTTFLKEDCGPDGL